MKADTRKALDEQNRKDQQEIRRQFESRAGTPLLTYEEALRRKLHTEWNDHHIAVPEFIGRRVLQDVPLTELVPYIDWSPFFHTWEMRGRYPDLLHDPARGAAARELFANAQELLQEIVAKKSFTARGVYGFYPANSQNDDIIVYADVTRTKERARLPGAGRALRQRTGSLQFDHGQSPGGPLG